MERMCKHCGQVYRGRVCHKCNPRRKRCYYEAVAAPPVQTMTPVPQFEQQTTTADVAASESCRGSR